MVTGQKGDALNINPFKGIAKISANHSGRHFVVLIGSDWIAHIMKERGGREKTTPCAIEAMSMVRGIKKPRCKTFDLASMVYIP